MSLEKTINTDIKHAMIARDKRKLESLRAVKSALLLIKTGKDTSFAEVPEELEIKTLQKLIKQRKESAKIYKEQNRDEAYEEEMYQAEIIEAYLPTQMSEEEVTKVVVSIIEKTGASSMKDMGKVMGMASKELAGKADNSLVSKIVREKLA
ncbi:MAG: GatB/YqeY domain-containing protein [Bacteroidales bacterium]|nr:GatB/YqeY domain-containing protein [Bacteroidales bacterium]